MVTPLIEQQTDELMRIKMTYEEFLARFDEHAHVEWADGEAIVHMPPTESHQQVIWLLSTVLGLFVEIRNLGMVLTAPFELLLPTGTSREPDILFLSREHYGRRGEKRWKGIADLLIEVQSAGTALYDLREKPWDYQRAGVPEYWALDPRPRYRLFRPFVLSASGQYEEAPFDSDGRYHSTVVPGFWLKPSWFWQNPLPKAIDLITEIAPEVFGR
jgi:Uma2 family endonuclease